MNFTLRADTWNWKSCTRMIFVAGRAGQGVRLLWMIFRARESYKETFDI